MEEDINTSNSIKKIVKIVLKLLYQILVIFCLILSVVIVFQKITDSNRSVAGYRLFRVITGSMEPEYNVGEVVISKEVDPNTIKIGDDIVYMGQYGEYNGKIIMHSVIAIDKDNNGNLTFHAKGLHSSSVEDPRVSANQIYGVVKYKSDLLTILYKLATNIYSVFIIISILTLNVVIAFRTTKRRKFQTLSEGKSINEVNLYNEDDDEEDISEDEIEEQDDGEENKEEDTKEQQDEDI
mgnify:FL=1